MINPELKIGDNIILYHMEGETSVAPGTKGIVTSINEVAGDIIYGVDWKNGSKLSLLAGTDYWKLNKKINESERERMSVLTKDAENIKLFDVSFLYKYLKKIKNCGVVNMFLSAPFLYMGKNRMNIELQYHRSDNEFCDEILELADESQSKMIQGVIKVLEKEKKDYDLDKINSYLKKYSNKLLTNYIHLH
jgi:hypothetical protein